MSEDTEPTLLMVARVDDMPRPTPGSITSTCEFCNEPVWISMAGMQARLDGAELACMQCAMGKMAPGDTLEPAPGVDEELRHLLTPDEYAAAMEVLNEIKMGMSR